MGCRKLSFDKDTSLESNRDFSFLTFSKKGQPEKSCVEYHPLGSTSYRSGTSAAEVSLKRYRYVGKERDDETGLYYYGARYYAAWLARFVSVDSLKDDYPKLSPFNYADNDPIGGIDVNGLQSETSEKTPRGIVHQSDATSHIGVKDRQISFEVSQRQQREQTQLFQLNPNAVNPNQTTIRASAPKTFSQVQEDRRALRRMEIKEMQNQLRSDISATSPFVGGGEGFGMGFQRTMGTAATEGALMLTGEYIFTKGAQAYRLLDNALDGYSTMQRIGRSTHSATGGIGTRGTVGGATSSRQVLTGRELESQLIAPKESLGSTGNVTYSEGSNRVWAYVDDAQVGFYEFDFAGNVFIELNIPAHLRGSGVGSSIFKEAVKDSDRLHALWIRSEKLYGDIGGISTNLAQFEKAVAGGLTEGEAIWSTWTGKRALESGFTNAQLQHVDNGVKVIFTR